MPNTSLLNKAFALSPHIEMLGRRLYWGNVKRLANKAKNSRKVTKSVQKPVDFTKIEEFIHAQHDMRDRVLLVHSAYGALKGAALKPGELVDRLAAIVGKKGTLAMPAIPTFKNSSDVENYLTEDISSKEFVYDVQNSPIGTGILPKVLCKREGSIRSRFPINSMVVNGPLSNSILDNNLDDENSLACGKNSSWQRCVEHDAVIVALGTDMAHSLTMIHVAEDMQDGTWPVKDWYRPKHFVIKDGDYERKITLRERQPKWGALHYGERTLCKDLIKAKLMKSTIIDDVVVEIMLARDLIDFLNSKNKKGYPYFWV